ncbi:hypothetical protein QM027_00395 [Campylobacter concisus]
MATRIGVIKSISQGSSVIATAKDGTQRVLKVGDEIFLVRLYKQLILTQK